MAVTLMTNWKSNPGALPESIPISPLSTMGSPAVTSNLVLDWASLEKYTSYMLLYTII